MADLCRLQDRTLEGRPQALTSILVMTRVSDQ